MRVIFYIGTKKYSKIGIPGFELEFGISIKSRRVISARAQKFLIEQVDFGNLGTRGVFRRPDGLIRAQCEKGRRNELILDKANLGG